MKIKDVLRQVVVAYLGGFFADGELPGRDMTTISYPFIADRMKRFSNQR